MKTYQARSSARIEAPAAQLYAIIADYKQGHPSILPRPPFLNLEVEEGGVGAGTRIRFQMRVAGKTQTARATISEPEPGRVLVETIPEQSIVTTFMVDPLEGGQAAQVSIITELRARGGPLGAIERFLSTRFLEGVYKRELAQLAQLAQG